VDTSLIERVEGPSGHAVIQVVPDGENAIILHGGANRKITRDYIQRVMARFAKGDFLLLQNEINGVAECLEAAAGLGLRVFFNPAPMDRGVLDYPLEMVGCFIINETEGTEFTAEKEPGRILSVMVERYPRAVTVLTLGEKGTMLAQGGKRMSLPAEKVTAVDTTAAGDTFIGFFIASFMKGQDMEDALRMANRAAALCVTKPGAAPTLDKVRRRFFPDAPPQSD
jgi:ribokinase